MSLVVGMIVTAFACASVLYSLNKKDAQQNKVVRNPSKLLSCACNKNSYTKARDVFKTLEEAGIEPNFLGGQHE